MSTRARSCCRYAWYKLFNLAKTYNKNLTPADVQQLSCNVLLSALSILPYEAPETARTEAELELEKDRSMRMATILGFNLVSLLRSHLCCSALIKFLWSLSWGCAANANRALDKARTTESLMDCGYKAKVTSTVASEILVAAANMRRKCRRCHFRPLPSVPAVGDVTVQNWQKP